MAPLNEPAVAGVPLPAADVLGKAYAAAGQQPIDAAIPPHFAAELTRQVRTAAPRIAIEIGMANGLSTVAILAGLPRGSKLISIDPFQRSEWHSEGLRLVAATDRCADHTLIEEPDYLALPELLRHGVVVDFVYIDGMHTFDYVALDAFYADKLLPVGGIVAFNDCGFRSIHKFLNYFRKHHRYSELSSRLPANFRGRNPLVTLMRAVQGRSNQDRYFRKLEAWEGEHNFFRNF